MAPIKFEDNLKEKLEQRKLQPSKNAWEKLSNKLETNKVKKDNKTFWWFSIAASFAGILIVASVFFNKRDDNSIEQNIVDVEDTKIPNKSDSNISNEISKEVVLDKPKDKKETLKTNKNTSNKASELKTLMHQKQQELIKEEEDNNGTMAQVKFENPNEIIENSSKAEAKLSFEDLKLQEVVSQVQELKKANSTVSDAEINALLDQAQRDIALHKLYNESTKKVDANALLQDVEADLEQSFRDRAFKAIKSGYHYVKTTVTERNN